MQDVVSIGVLVFFWGKNSYPFLGISQEHGRRGWTQATWLRAPWPVCSPWLKNSAQALFSGTIGSQRSMLPPCQPGSYKCLLWNTIQTIFGFWTDYVLAHGLLGSHVLWVEKSCFSKDKAIAIRQKNHETQRSLARWQLCQFQGVVGGGNRGKNPTCLYLQKVF